MPQIINSQNKTFHIIHRSANEGSVSIAAKAKQRIIQGLPCKVIGVSGELYVDLLTSSDTFLADSIGFCTVGGNTNEIVTVQTHSMGTVLAVAHATINTGDKVTLFSIDSTYSQTALGNNTPNGAVFYGHPQAKASGATNDNFCGFALTGGAAGEIIEVLFRN